MKETKNARFRRVAEARVNKLSGCCAFWATAPEQTPMPMTPMPSSRSSRHCRSNWIRRESDSPKRETGTKSVLSFASADAGHRFVSAHHAASAGRHTSSSRRLCRYDLSGHQSVSTAGWRAGGTRMLCGIQLGAQPLPRALHRRLHFRCGGHSVLWAISAGKGNEVWKM